MSRKAKRQTNMRARIAAEAARIMAEDGIDNFALAKRKAARRLGASDTESLPRNDEVEAQLHAYRALYQPQEHSERIAVLAARGAGRHARIQTVSSISDGPGPQGHCGSLCRDRAAAFPQTPKDVEIDLLERGVSFSTQEARRFSGERAHAVSVFLLHWQGAPLKLSVFDCRDERLALKTSQAGRVMERGRCRRTGSHVA